MADEQHRPPPLPPASHHREHHLRQVGRQRGGDLVEQQDQRIERDRPGQVDHPQERQRDVTDLLVEVESGQTHPLQLGLHGVYVGTGQPQVLAYGQVGDQRRVLEHGRQPVPTGVGGAVERHRVPSKVDLTGVRSDDAGEDLDQRRLPGAVGAQQGMDLAGRHRQLHRAQRDDRAERLGDGRGRQQGLTQPLCRRDRSRHAGHSPGPLQAKS